MSNLVIKRCPICDLWLPEGDLSDPCPSCLARWIASGRSQPFPPLSEEPNRGIYEL